MKRKYRTRMHEMLVEEKNPDRRKTQRAKYYYSNLHHLVDDDVVLSKLIKVLKSHSPLHSLKKATSEGWQPKGKTFTILSRALFYIDQGKSKMTFQEYCLHLKDRI